MEKRAASDRSSGTVRAAASLTAEAAIAASAAAVCFTLYLATLTPGLTFLKGDSHELTVAAATLGVPHPSGYPLYTWLAHLFTTLPIGELAYRTNLFSSVAASAAVGMLFLLGRATGLPRLPAAFAALLFGISTTFWSQAVITEVYAPNACALLVTMWLLVRWASTGRRRYLVGTALALGLSLGTQIANLTYAPVFALFVLLHAPGVLRRPLLLTGLVAAFLAGAAQFGWLALRADVIDVFPSRSPNTWEALVAYVFGPFWYVGARPLAAQPGQLAFFVDELVRNVTPAGVVLGAIGMWRLAWHDPRTFWLVAGVFAVNVATSLQPRVMDLHVFFIPSHAMFALFAGFGVEGVWRATSILLSPTSEASMASRIAGAAGAAVLVMGLAVLGRANYARNDRSGDTAVGDFRRSVFAGVPAGSKIVAGRGAFGREMVYARLVDDASRRFVLPSIDRPLAGQPQRQPAARGLRPLYVMTRMIDGSLDARRWALAPANIPRHPWTVARIVGGHSGLILYRVTRSAPDLLVSRADASEAADRTLGGPLHDYVLEPATTADGRIRLTTYWATDERDAPVVTLRLRGEVLDAHEVGYGSWARTVGRAGSTPALFMERVDLVVPSDVPAGTHALELGIVELARTGPSVRWIRLGDVSIG